MDVILLERVAKLGQMGERVKVKDGFARNFLLPRGKALRATEANAKKFETQRVQLEARNLELKAEAAKVAEGLDGQSFTMIRQAGESGQLYGSVSSRDIAEAITAGGYEAGFSVGAFYRAQGVEVPDPAFLEEVVYRFHITEAAQHFHLPFKFTPWGFSLFRGGA